MLVAATLLGLRFTALMGNAEGIDAMKNGINHCRHIVISIKIYASDNNGDYPDAKVPAAKSSNEAFRELFRERSIEGRDLSAKTGNEVRVSQASDPFCHRVARGRCRDV